MKNTLLLLAWLCLTVTARAQEIVTVEYLGSRTKAELNELIGPFAQYDVDLYKMTYETTGSKGQLDTASGLVVVPLAEGLAFPMALVEHGTTISRDDVPSNLAGGWELGGLAGALGFVVAMPDYLGMGESAGFHPYVHAATEASASVDMLLALQEWTNMGNAATNGQLFITGYSQGGHAAMASHRLLESEYADIFTVTAAAHLSGPYNMSGAQLDFILRDADYATVDYLPYLIMGYNEVYGIYDSLAQWIKQPYADLALQYYRNEIDRVALNTLLSEAMVDEFGTRIPKLLLQDSIRAAVEARDSTHPAMQVLLDNDVYDWTPLAPTRLYYCQGDDQVFYRNSVVADSVMTLNGASDIAALDLNSGASHTECISPAALATIIFFTPYIRVVTSADDLAEQMPLRLFPNPAGDQVFLDSAPAGAQVALLSANGQLLTQSTVQSDRHEIRLTGLPKGIYWLQVVSDAGVRVQKLIKQ